MTESGSTSTGSTLEPEASVTEEMPKGGWWVGELVQQRFRWSSKTLDVVSKGWVLDSRRLTPGPVEKPGRVLFTIVPGYTGALFPTQRDRMSYFRFGELDNTLQWTPDRVLRCGWKRGY